MKHRPEIQGLRAIAVLYVVFSHFEFPFFSGGFIGVDIFFVISGYLITSLICREYLENVSQLAYGKIFSLRQFYIRRAKRILPLSLFVILTTALGSKILMNPEQSRAVVSDGYWAGLFMANLRLIRNATDYFANGTFVSPLQHYWSLSVEEQFYFVFPALIFAQLKYRRKYLFGRRLHWRASLLLLVLPLCTFSFIYSLVQTTANPTAAYFSTLTRAWELGVGAILAIAVSGNTKKPNRSFSSLIAMTGLLLIILSGSIFDKVTRMPGIPALLPTLGACAVIFGTTFHLNSVSMILSWKPFLFLGKISYSIYLWHWPILIFFGIQFPEKADSFPAKILVIALIIAVSTLSFVYIEETFRHASFPKLNLNRKARYFLNKSLLLLLFCLVLSISVSLSFFQKSTPQYKAQNFVATQPSDQNVIDNFDENNSQNPKNSGREIPFLQNWVPLLQSALTIEKVPTIMKPSLSNLKNTSEYWKNCFAKTNAIPCTYGNSNASPNRIAVVYGDSYAISVLPSILGSLDLNEWRVDVLTFGECMIADVTPLRNGKAVDGCNSYRDWATSYILQHDHSLLFLADNPDGLIADSTGKIVYDPGTSMNPYWVKQMTQSLTNLQSSKSLMVVVGAPPQPVESLGQCVSNGLSIGKGCFAKSGSRSGPRTLAKAISQRNADVFVDLERLFCLRGICPPIIDGTPVFLDGGHISFEMSTRIAPYFKEQISQSPKFIKLTE